MEHCTACSHAAHRYISVSIPALRSAAQVEIGLKNNINEKSIKNPLHIICAVSYLAEKENQCGVAKPCSGKRPFQL